MFYTLQKLIMAAAAHYVHTAIDISLNKQSVVFKGSLCTNFHMNQSQILRSGNLAVKKFDKR